MDRIQTDKRAFVLLLIVVWTGFGIFFGTQDYVRDVYVGRPASFPGLLISWILCGYSWALLTVPVMLAVRKFALARLGWLRFFAAHVPLAALFALLQLGVYVLIAMLLPGAKARSPWEFYQVLAVTEFQTSFLVYFVIVSAVTAYDKWFAATDARSEASTVRDGDHLPNGNGHGHQNGSGGGFARRFSIKENGRIVLVDADDINWVESYGNYVFLHTAGRRHILRETMAAMERKLDPEQFVRVRRSAIVRADQIAELRLAVNGEYEVKLHCGDTVASTRRYRKNLEAYIRN